LTATPAPVNPFDASIARAGFPLAGYTLSVESSGEWAPEALRSLLDLLEHSGSPEVRRNLLWVSCFVACRCRGGREADFGRLAALVQELGDQGDVDLYLSYDVAPPNNCGAQRLKFYDSCGLAPHLHVGGELEPYVAWAVHWEQAFLREPRRVGLLRLLARCVLVTPAGTRVPPELLSPGSYPNRRIALAALLVRLNQEGLAEAEAQELAGWVAHLLGTLDTHAGANAANLLFSTVEKHLDRVPALEAFLIALREKIPPGVELGVARCEGLLRRVIRKRPSGLQQPGRLAALGLPNLLPAPA
jgi:hypothetical protein